MFAEKESTPFDKKEENIPIDKQEEIFYRLVAELTNREIE